MKVWLQKAQLHLLFSVMTSTMSTIKLCWYHCIAFFETNIKTSGELGALLQNYAEFR